MKHPLCIVNVHQVVLIGWGLGYVHAVCLRCSARWSVYADNTGNVRVVKGGT